MFIIHGLVGWTFFGFSASPTITKYMVVPGGGETLSYVVYKWLAIYTRVKFLLDHLEWPPDPRGVVVCVVLMKES